MRKERCAHTEPWSVFNLAKCLMPPVCKGEVTDQNKNLGFVVPCTASLDERAPKLKVQAYRC